MVVKEIMIKLRIDVDYAYPSRPLDFLCTFLSIKRTKNYLRNAKIIARMINESPRKVKTYWFFTPQTTPDNELLRLLVESNHEIALHVARDAYAEWRLLEKRIKRKVRYYTVHGTERLLARLMWRRKPWEDKAKIPKNLQLISFYKYPTVGLDLLCFNNPTEKVVKIAEDKISQGKILHVHPVWLFQQGAINRRGPYYETLKTILKVDNELQTLSTNRKILVRITKDAREYKKDIMPTMQLLSKLAERGIDIFTFVERVWLRPKQEFSDSWVRTEDNIALLEVETFQTWWRNVGKKTRNMVRKAEKSGVIAKIVQPSEKFARGIWRIHNETPIRQQRAYPHYGEPLQAIKKGVLGTKDSTFIGAFLQEELIGFEKLTYGDRIAVISQILSMQKYFDKAVNNTLIAKAVEVCASKRIRWLMYGTMGNHPSLDRFKRNNGFIRLALNRYFVPLSKKGEIAIALGLHRNIKEVLPQSTKKLLIPIYNWLSRIKIRAKLSFSSNR